MTARIYPVDAVNGAPQYSGRAWRQTAVAPLAAGAKASRPLGAYSGVRPGTSTTTVTATSTTWSAAAFGGLIDGEAANEAGPYGFAFDAVTTGGITAANASNPRVDGLYVTVSDPAEQDGSSTPGVAINYVAGAASATPVPPATPARSFRIARLNVPKSGGGTPTVTWDAPTAIAAGGVLPIDTLANLQLFGGGLGQQAHVLADPVVTNNGLWAFVGATAGAWANAGGWIPIGAGAKTVVAPTGPAVNWSIDPESRITRVGDTVTLHLFASRTGGIGVNLNIFTLPVNFRPFAQITPLVVIGSGPGPGIGWGNIGTNGQVGTGNYLSASGPASTLIRIDSTFQVS